MATVKVSSGLLLSVCLASAQLGWWHSAKGPEKNPDRSGTSVLGIVLKTTPETFVVRAVDTRLITYRIADSTLYFHGTKWVRPSQLRRGAIVTVDAVADLDGKLTATDVVFEDAKPAIKARAKASELLPTGIKDDPVVSQARLASETLVKMLPNFVCQQSTSRYFSERDKQWRALDRVSAEVVYEHAHETYRDIKLNGRPMGKSIMDLPGANSTGEFGTTLRALFDRETDALYQFQSNATMSGFSTAVYEYAVSGDQTNWTISAGSQTILTPYTGRIWIDRRSGHVVRIEKKAAGIPEAFPFRRVEATVEYGPIMLSSQRYFLPIHAENLVCQDEPKGCSRNDIEFRNYHRYVGESSISFEEPEPESDPDPKH